MSKPNNDFISHLKKPIVNIFLSQLFITRKPVIWGSSGLLMKILFKKLLKNFHNLYFCDQLPPPKNRLGTAQGPL